MTSELNSGEKAGAKAVTVMKLPDPMAQPTFAESGGPGSRTKSLLPPPLTAAPPVPPTIASGAAAVLVKDALATMTKTHIQSGQGKRVILTPLQATPTPTSAPSTPPQSIAAPPNLAFTSMNPKGVLAGPVPNGPVMRTLGAHNVGAGAEADHAHIRPAAPPLIDGSAALRQVIQNGAAADARDPLKTSFKPPPPPSAAYDHSYAREPGVNVSGTPSRVDRPPPDPAEDISNASTAGEEEEEEEGENENGVEGKEDGRQVPVGLPQAPSSAPPAQQPKKKRGRPPNSALRAKAIKEHQDRLGLTPATSTPRSGDPDKSRRRGRGCGGCVSCLRDDCGKCRYCRDKPKFGGPGRKKQRCALRICSNFVTVAGAQKRALVGEGRLHPPPLIQQPTRPQDSPVTSLPMEVIQRPSIATSSNGASVATKPQVAATDKPEKASVEVKERPAPPPLTTTAVLPPPPPPSQPTTAPSLQTSTHLQPSIPHPVLTKLPQQQQQQQQPTNAVLCPTGMIASSSKDDKQLAEGVNRADTVKGQLEKPQQQQPQILNVETMMAQKIPSNQKTSGNQNSSSDQKTPDNQKTSSNQNASRDQKTITNDQKTPSGQKKPSGQKITGSLKAGMAQKSDKDTDGKTPSRGDATPKTSASTKIPRTRSQAERTRSQAERTHSQVEREKRQSNGSSSAVASRPITDAEPPPCKTSTFTTTATTTITNTVVGTLVPTPTAPSTGGRKRSNATYFGELKMKCLFCGRERKQAMARSSKFCTQRCIQRWCEAHPNEDPDEVGEVRGEVQPQASSMKRSKKPANSRELKNLQIDMALPGKTPPPSAEHRSTPAASASPLSSPRLAQGSSVGKASASSTKKTTDDIGRGLKRLSLTSQPETRKRPREEKEDAAFTPTSKGIGVDLSNSVPMTTMVLPISAPPLTRTVPPPAVSIMHVDQISTLTAALSNLREPRPNNRQFQRGLSSNVRTWAVDQVVQYFESTKDCRDYAEIFKEQEVDGAALLLLTHESLVKCLGIKLGRALKIMLHVEELKKFQESSE